MEHLLPPLHETAAQTAPRLRRRLRDRWPTETFTVRAEAFSQTVTVTWTGGPSESEVHDVTRHHCRLKSPAGGVLWSAPNGNISVVQPAATVHLRRLDSSPQDGR